MRLTIPLAVSQGGVFTQRRLRQWSKATTIVLFLLPSLALFVLFVIIPVVQAAHYSLYDWSGLGGLDDYIGLKNYQTLFKDPIFLTALKDNFLIAVLSLLTQLPSALALALLINRRVPGRTFFRTVFFLPYILSEVVTGLIWSFIYNPSNGLIAGLVHQINPHATPPAYLADTHTVLAAIFVAMCWKYFGFHLVLYVAGLQNIPGEVLEAAQIDGASAWQTTRHVTLPLLGSTIRLSVFLSILGSLQYFDLIWVMSDGGPVHASETMATYLIHFGLQQFALGYGSAVGVIMFGLCLVFALLYQRVIMRQDLVGSSAM
ncbi:MAG TPA: sugar ABC transporter permease [Ktedonobacterales bacterium]|nr:sugar ABC transporter permease [Ktedonobacterales bacterium]